MFCANILYFSSYFDRRCIQCTSFELFFLAQKNCRIEYIGRLHFQRHLCFCFFLNFFLASGYQCWRVSLFLIFLEFSHYWSNYDLYNYGLDVCRYLRHLGYEVMYVRNFTDVDDKVRKLRQLFEEFLFYLFGAFLTHLIAI